MNKKELENKLSEIHTQLAGLGTLSELVQKGGLLPTLVTELEAKKVALEAVEADLPTHAAALKQLLDQVTDTQTQLKSNTEEGQLALKKFEELNEKSQKLQQETLAQLGRIANEGLASSFGKVQDELSKEKRKWFRWLVGAVVTLVVATAGIVYWQIIESGTLYHLNFLLKVALTSPIVYFIVFVNREYNRTRNLIEEYTFKESIARSFEAYKEIIEEIFSDKQSEVYSKKLEFILAAIADLYSSPMRNIKRNGVKDQVDSPDMLAQMRQIISEPRTMTIT